MEKMKQKNEEKEMKETQEARQLKQIKKEKKPKSIFNSTIRIFVIRIILTALLIHLFFLCLYMLAEHIVFERDFQWLYDRNPFLYRNLRILFYAGPNNTFILAWELFLFVLVVIFHLYRLVKELYAYIMALAEASGQLLDKNVDYIVLPAALEEIEAKLNMMKMVAEKNERSAEENEKKKNDLIVYLAHDLKTPLTSMIGYLSLLEEAKDMPAAQREKYLEIALEKSYKLEDLINELFYITRFNENTLVLEKEKLDLNMMLQQIVEDFYPILKNSGKEINLRLQEKRVIFADSDKMYRVFNNLIKNAIYYSTDSQIDIEVEKAEEKRVAIVISNQGKELPKEKLERLFDKFYRADSSRNTGTGGSGLGLAIAREIVELHGGTIRAEAADGRIRFRVELLEAG